MHFCIVRLEVWRMLMLAAIVVCATFLFLHAARCSDSLFSLSLQLNRQYPTLQYVLYCLYSSWLMYTSLESHTAVMHCEVN
jgi:hypothetical protein